MYHTFQYTRLTDLLEGHQAFLQDSCLAPFLGKIEAVLPQITAEFNKLRFVFMEAKLVIEIYFSGL